MSSWQRATQPIKGLRQVNSSVPIVFVLVANVVESGLVKSQALPGRNMTGFTNFEPAIAGKWLEVLTLISFADFPCCRPNSTQAYQNGGRGICWRSLRFLSS
jgi:hypothetical protein